MILSVDFAEEPAFAVELSSEDDIFETDFGEVQRVGSDEIPKYAGPCTVTPSVEPQTLETAGKLMEEDMQIKAIPFWETSNTAGGSTVYIGLEM